MRSNNRAPIRKAFRNEIVPGVSQNDLKKLTDFLNGVYNDIVMNPPYNNEYTVEREIHRFIEMIDKRQVWTKFVQHIKKNHYEKYILGYACFRAALKIPYFREMFGYNYGADEFFQAYHTLYGMYFGVLKNTLVSEYHDDFRILYPNKTDDEREELKELYKQAIRRYSYIVLDPGLPRQMHKVKCKSMAGSRSQHNSYARIINLLTKYQYSGGNSFGGVPSGRQGRLVRKQYRGFV